MEVKQHIDFVLDAEKCLAILVEAASSGKNAIKIQLAITDEGKFKVLVMPTKVTNQGPLADPSDMRVAHEACPVPPGCTDGTRCKEIYDTLVTVLENFSISDSPEGLTNRAITFNY